MSRVRVTFNKKSVCLRVNGCVQALKIWESCSSQGNSLVSGQVQVSRYMISLMRQGHRRTQRTLIASSPSEVFPLLVPQLGVGLGDNKLRAEEVRVAGTSKLSG